MELQYPYLLSVGIFSCYFCSALVYFPFWPSFNSAITYGVTFITFDLLLLLICFIEFSG